MRTVRRTAQSRLDYLEIWLYIAERNYDAADKLIATFDQKLALLADFPGVGQARDDLIPGLRSLPVGSYLIFYRPRDDGIDLVRVVHGSRNLRKLFRRR